MGGTIEWVEAGGHRLRMRRSPKPGAPVLLLTNAWPQTIRCWDRQWDRLARRHELLAVDLPGFGLSSGTREVMRPSAQAAVLAALLERLGTAPPVMIAPDVGVPIALALADRHPGAVGSLVLFDGPADYPPDVGWEARLLYRSAVARRAMSLLGVPFTLETIRRGYRTKALRPSRAAVAEYIRAAASPRRFGLTLHYLGSYARELPRSGGWPGVDVPVLVTWGSEDAFLAPSNGERLAETLPHATWRPLAGVGHYAHEDAGERFLDLLDEWIAASFPSPDAAALAERE